MKKYDIRIVVEIYESKWTESVFDIHNRVSFFIIEY